MRYQLRLPGLAIAAMLIVTACNSSTSPTTAPASAAAPSAAAPSAAAPSDSAGAPASAGADVMGVDDGTKLTLWTRAATEARVRPLVEAYNASHKNQIELTVTPTDDYQTKVGAAAGVQRPAGPLLRRRRVHAELDVAGPVPGHHEQDRRPALRGQDRARRTSTSSTWDNKQYGLPFIVDLSVWMYNKALYRQAGLDPEKPPTTLAGVRGPGPCRRQARRRHPRHVLRRQLRRLRRVHLVADRLGRRRAGDEPRRHPVDAQQRREQADLLDVQEPRR